MIKAVILPIQSRNRIVKEKKHGEGYKKCRSVERFFLG